VWGLQINFCSKRVLEINPSSLVEPKVWKLMMPGSASQHEASSETRATVDGAEFYVFLQFLKWSVEDACMDEMGLSARHDRLQIDTGHEKSSVLPCSPTPQCGHQPPNSRRWSL
jgi:hypothetical protein